MPYFLYKITPPRALTHIATLDRYQDARAQVRALREQAREEQESGLEYRMIFAAQPGEAERLLAAPRDERVIGED
jgi:hypothetical protein